MRAALVIVLLAISAPISCQKSTENSVETSDLPYYDLLDCRLNAFASVMERLAELIQKNDAKLEDLISNVEEKFKTLSENQKQTADKMSQLGDSIAANNSRIAVQIEKLESVVTQNKKSLDKKINQMKKNHSRILERIEKLETVGALNKKSHDNQINEIKRNFSAVSDNITENNSRILQEIAELESARAHNQQSLTEMKRTLAAVSDNIKIIENRIPISSCKTTKQSGIYQMIDPAKIVYCEMNSMFGGGWLVIQQRVDLNLNFNRTWNDYRDGFGVVAKNESFWLGNEAVHQMTKGGDYELAIEWRDGNQRTREARYSQFRLAGEGEKYRLTVGGYSGSLEDNFSECNNMMFTTYDNDNDLWSGGNCAYREGSGWWYELNYDYCSYSDLNHYDGPYWHDAYNGYHFGDFSRMMIRRK